MKSAKYFFTRIIDNSEYWKVYILENIFLLQFNNFLSIIQTLLKKKNFLYLKIWVTMVFFHQPSSHKRAKGELEWAKYPLESL